VTATDVSSSRTYPGIVVAAVVLAVAAAVAAVPAPALALLLAAGGIWLALGSRTELRSRPELSGWGLSLAAMVVSVIVATATFLLLFAPVLFSWVFLAIDGGAP
jgi:hypothetical protein